MIKEETINCPYCGNEFKKGISWKNANYCRAAYLMPFLKKTTLMTSWDLAQKSGIGYTEVTRAMLRARDWGLIGFREEKVGSNGIRYRYYVTPEWQTIVKKWADEGLI